MSVSFKQKLFIGCKLNLERINPHDFNSLAIKLKLDYDIVTDGSIESPLNIRRLL